MSGVEEANQLADTRGGESPSRRRAVLMTVLAMGAFVVGTYALNPASSRAEVSQDPVANQCANWLFFNLGLCPAEDEEGSGGQVEEGGEELIFVESTAPPVKIEPPPRPSCLRLTQCLPPPPGDLDVGLEDLDRRHQEREQKKKADMEYAECIKRRKSGPKGETPCLVYCPRTNKFINPIEDDCVGEQKLVLRPPKLALRDLLGQHLDKIRICRRIWMELDYLQNVRDKLLENGHFSRKTWEAQGGADQWDAAIKAGGDNDCWAVSGRM